MWRLFGWKSSYEGVILLLCEFDSDQNGSTWLNHPSTSVVKGGNLTLSAILSHSGVANVA